MSALLTGWLNDCRSDGPLSLGLLIAHVDSKFPALFEAFKWIFYNPWHRQKRSCYIFRGISWKPFCGGKQWKICCKMSLLSKMCVYIYIYIYIYIYMYVCIYICNLCYAKYKAYSTCRLSTAWLWWPVGIFESRDDGGWPSLVSDAGSIF